MEKEVNELLKEKFLCQNKFTSDIEQLVLTTELNYIEAIISYCEEKNIEFESVGKLISKPLKDKLKAEATELNYLKRTSRSKLPLLNYYDILDRIHHYGSKRRIRNDETCLTLVRKTKGESHREIR